MDPLPQLIERAYVLFAGYRPGVELDTCTVCCMEPEDAEQLKRLPLREIPVQLLQYYQDAAKPEELDQNELRYFAPRYLELVKDFTFPSSEASLSLNRFGYFEWSVWTEEEQALFTEFRDLVFAKYLSCDFPSDPGPMSMLLLFHTAKFGIAGPLHQLRTCEAAYGLKRFSQLWDWLGANNKGTFCVTDAFADEAFNNELLAWLLSPDVRGHFLEAMELEIMEPSGHFTPWEQQQLSWQYEVLLNLPEN